MQLISQFLEHPNRLAYFAGANNYTWLQLGNGERRLLAKPLTYFEERLPAFVRIHKTALINPAYVAGVYPPPGPKKAGAVRMLDGTELPVSRRRWSDVVQHLPSTQAGGHPVVLPPDEPPAARPSAVSQPAVCAPLPLRVLAVMKDDALRLTEQCLDQLALNFALQHLRSGAALANALLLGPPGERPVLILLDARTNRADRVLTLRALKSHDRLLAIPVVWVGAPDDDPMQAYDLKANSVILVGHEPTAFRRAVEQVCRYWLMLVQLPPDGPGGLSG